MNEKGVLKFKKLVEGPKLGADSLVMGFPSCGQAFFLTLQLDNNFIPTLMLVECQPQEGATTNGPVHILRYITITADSFFVTDDEMDFCFLDENSQLAQHGRDGLQIGLEGDMDIRLLASPSNKMPGTAFKDRDVSISQISLQQILSHQMWQPLGELNHDSSPHDKVGLLVSTILKAIHCDQKCVWTSWSN